MARSNGSSAHGRHAPARAVDRLQARASEARGTDPSNELHGALASALHRDDDSAINALDDLEPRSRRDGALSLALIHDLHLAPIGDLGAAVRRQHHPAISALKGRLEQDLIRRLEADDQRVGWQLPDDPVAAVRAIAARDLVPPIYDWVATEADRDDVRTFLAFEGGPDGGFDDLVAACQIGLDGDAKLELARNYWDEMGRGSASAVHTELYRRFVAAVELPARRRETLPVEAVERSLLGSLLATNRWLQPEMVGALGTIELQAGPRCRRVLAGLERVGYRGDALPFYEEHAGTDPRHGKDWLDHVVSSLGDDPTWANGIVRGARWRWVSNARFFAAIGTHLRATAHRSITRTDAA